MIFQWFYYHSTDVVGDFCPIGTGIQVTEESEVWGEAKSGIQSEPCMEEGEGSDDMVIGGESGGGRGVGGGEAEEEVGE